VRKGKLFQKDFLLPAAIHGLCSKMTDMRRCDRFRATDRAGEWRSGFSWEYDCITDGATTTNFVPVVTSHLCLPNILLPAVASLIRGEENGVLLYGIAIVV